MMDRLIRNAARAYEFGRHIPMAKLARRAELSARRTLRDRLQLPVAGSLPPLRAACAPMPLFAPRTGHLAADGDGLQVTFLGRTETLSLPGLNWRAPGPGAAHQLWRMNLHYMEYLEPASGPLFAALVGDWIAANPARAQGTWKDSWNSYALSLRVVVWMQQLAARASRLAPALRAAAEASLAGQLRYLVANLETDVGGNHLIKNIKALIWASCHFAGAEPDRWRQLGLKLLARELDRQILADGMHNERSPSYHAQVFADLLECRHALAHDPLGGRLDAALAQMAQVTADLAHPDGSPALFNDAGLTMAYTPAQCLAAFAEVYGRLPSPRKIFAFSQAGYFGARNAGSYIVADCGRIAPDDLPAHGHGDVLSFEWSVAGQRIIVDQGVFEYIAGTRRQQARSAVSHNTLCFEGADQADFFGAFRCGRRPNVVLIGYAATPDSFELEGSHDGFDHLPGKPRHVRRLLATSQGMSIADRIEGKSDRPALIGFLLHPEVSVSANGSQVTLMRDATRIVLAASHPVTIEDAVWWPDMGQAKPTQRLIVRLEPPASKADMRFSIESPVQSLSDFR